MQFYIQACHFSDFEGGRFWMKSAKQFISSWVLSEGLNYVEKNPVANLSKLVYWAEKLVIREDHKQIVQMVKGIADDRENNWNIFLRRILEELNPTARKKLLVNFLVNSEIYGRPLADKLRAQYGCHFPWAILMDPTTACNLNCVGCWAADYDKTDSMELDVLDRIIREGKELGIYMFIYSGGEPLVRKKELIQLAEKHDDCMFLAFTNATLVDEEFAGELARVGNFALAISVEGYAEETDMRRGVGTFDKVMRAMDWLKQKGVAFGFSTCYHAKNTQTVGSDEYMDFLIEKGCLFGWYFTYLPIGKEAVTDLMVSPEQREFMYRRVREARETKPIFVLDFWNDGEYVKGCIAGGRNYFHINANGDVEPCAFVHYSTVNIKDVSVLEALQNPLFKEYQANQPFNHNHLRPCPLLDNPNRLKEMVHKVDAHSTQTIDRETVDELTDKCQDAAKKWGVKAEELWDRKNS